MTARGIVIGDSIAEGLAAAAGWRKDALQGIGSAEVLRRARASAPGHDQVVISTGSNDPDNPRLEANVVAMRAAVDRGARVVWVLPSNSARAAKIISAEAARQGDATVAFLPGSDGVHPQSYAALARDVGRALASESTMPVTPASAWPEFDRQAPLYMDKLAADFGFSPEDGAAVMGNAGHESNGLRIAQEVKPISGGRGGLGTFQWTGPRRVAYEAWLKRKGARPFDFEADYAFLFRELTGPEKRAVPATKAAVGLYNKVVAFERGFERAHKDHKHYDSRHTWAKRALAAYEKRGPVKPVKPAAAAAKSASAPPPPPATAIPPVIMPAPAPRIVRIGELIDKWFG